LWPGCRRSPVASHCVRWRNRPPRGMRVRLSYPHSTRSGRPWPSQLPPAEEPPRTARAACRSWPGVGRCDFVVFLIGVRVNRWSANRSWRPAMRAMPRMLAELRRRPDLGLLRAYPAWMFGGPASIQSDAPTTISSPTPEAPIVTTCPPGARSITPHAAQTQLASGTRPTASPREDGRRSTGASTDSGHEKLPGDGHEAARWRT